MRLWPAAVLLLALSVNPALAQGYVRCLEEQLAHLGKDTGVIDDQIGAATLRAATEIAPNDLPPLTARTAFVWCQALGRSDPDLRAYWPALADDPVRMPPNLVGTVLQTVTIRAVDQSRQFFHDRYDHDLVGGFAFIAGTTAAQVETAAMALRLERGGDASRMFSAEPMPCGSSDVLRAIAFRDMALFCAAAPPAYDDAWVSKNQRHWSRVLVHEYAHGLQNELAGVHAGPRLPSGEHTLGPKWLVEGSAEVFEEEFYATITRFSERSIGKHTRIMRSIDTPLNALRDKVSSTPDYDVSQYAADLLGQRFGRAALLDYFAALRNATSWDDAFKVTFGMSIDEYEARFEDLRDSLVAAHAFGKGQE